MVLRRMVALFSLLVLGGSAVLYRVFFIASSGEFAAAARQQSSYTLEVLRTRGGICDRRMEPLVNRTPRYLAAVSATPQAAVALRELAGPEAFAQLAGRLQQGYPFVTELPQAVQAEGLEVFTGFERYDEAPLAVHLIGHLGSDGHGAYGLEKAYDSLLADAQTVSVRYAVDANRRVLPGVSPQVLRTDSGAGVVLTLDARLQRIVQRAAKEIETGAVVVMDVQTGELFAAVSKPEFDPNALEQSLDAPGYPFVNRVLSTEYNVGSIFKLVDVMAALEAGVMPEQRYTCEGSLEVEEVVFHCHNRAGHGEIDLNTAIERSCNPYFIRLVQELGAGAVVRLAAKLGFGTSTVLAPDLCSAPGYLPTAQELALPAEAANLAFGQGRLTATPLQIAQLVSAIANGGYAVTPRLVRGVLGEDGALQELAAPEGEAVVSPRTAAVTRRLMVNTVQHGSGRSACPETGGAGGKTGSAQTGRYDEAGEEIVQAWFAGYFPQAEPRFAVAVVVEGGDSGSERAAPVFKAIADAVAREAPELLEETGRLPRS